MGPSQANQGALEGNFTFYEEDFQPLGFSLPQARRGSYYLNTGKMKGAKKEDQS